MTADDADVPATDEPWDNLLASDTPSTALALSLALSWARAMTVVGLALAASFPRPEDMVDFLNDEEVQQEISAYAALIRDIRLTAAAGLAGDSVTAFEEIGKAHRARALEAVTLSAERLGVDPEDLLTFYLHAG